MQYDEFLEGKAVKSQSVGIDAESDPGGILFDFQRDIVRWALRRGRAAIFADCGLGKTPMQLEWARTVAAEECGCVLILAPLAVAQQTVREGEKFGIRVKYVRDHSEVDFEWDADGTPIHITNYEMLEHFRAEEFAGVVLDESSILKAYDGKTRTAIIDAFRDTPYKLACTATPAPNDFMELGNHAEFMGAMTRAEMLSMFFVHDGGETQKWRLKGHAESEFWRWVCSWAVMLRKPSDLGYDDGDFILPELVYHDVTVRVDEPGEGMLFPMDAGTLQERLAARRDTIEDRVAHAAAIANATDEPFILWCNLNAESVALRKAIPGSVEVTGSDPIEAKESAIAAFSAGDTRVLISKPSICGYGMNWQHCNNVGFVGLSDSYEQFYQAVRRCWRFGQGRSVNAYIVTAETEGAVLANIKRKERDAEKMAGEMVANMHEINEQSIHGTEARRDAYARDIAEGEGWTLHLGDCVDVVAENPDESIGYSIYSPPFASLYTYSASERDMGNCAGVAQFADHYRYLVNDIFRVTMPGRLTSFHCMNLPTSKTHHGYIGIRDFRGELIRIHEAAGWIFHSEVVIWKDPVTAMQRTKALGLLHKQLKKDSCMSRQGIPDYLVTMRKPGENESRVGHTDQTFPVQEWQRYASPVWGDINPSDTLQFRSAREHNDERHICPLQLEVIRRGVRLWSNPGDTILSPFAGIGSEGFVAVEADRRFIGAELKRSYFDQAVRNLSAANRRTGDLFGVSA